MDVLSLESNLNIANDIVMNKPFYAMESPLVLQQERRQETITTKIVNALKKFVNWLYDMVMKLVNLIPMIAKKIETKFSSEVPSATIVDTHGFVEIVQRSMVIIDQYTKVLKSLRILDLEINKSTSLMDDVKGKLKDTTITTHTKQPSKRDNLENVILHFQKAEEYKDDLDHLTNQIIKPLPLPNPKRYTLSFLKREIEIGLNNQRTVLLDLKRELENSKTMYNDKSFLYRKVHGGDIKRNQDILNHTSYVIEKIALLQETYPKIITDI